MVMDVTDMSALEASTFDSVVDKGTLVALLVRIPNLSKKLGLTRRQCGEGSAENADRMYAAPGPRNCIRCAYFVLLPTIIRCSEISRLLKPGGTFMLITYGSPKTRMQYLEPRKYQWDVSKFTV